MFQGNGPLQPVKFFFNWPFADDEKKSSNQIHTWNEYQESPKPGIARLLDEQKEENKINQSNNNQKDVIQHSFTLN